MSRWVRSLPLVAALLFVTPADAQAPAAEGERQGHPEQLLEEATRKLLRYFQLMLETIPQYEAPEILENGDIIIRRKRPRPSRPDQPPGAPDQTKT